jgi:hypothetical protein
MKSFGKMRIHALAVVMMIALSGAIALAHGDKKHVIGTVEKVTADSVVVKTATGKSVEVKLLPSTIFIYRDGNDDRPGKQGELAVGNRVVIHATPRGELLEANEVRFSAPSSTVAKPRR